MARSTATKSKRKERAASAGGKKTGANRAESSPGRRREILGVVLLALGLTLILALWSFTPLDKVLLEEGFPATHNLIGPFGHHLAGTLLSVIGLGAFVFAFALLSGALACFVRRRVHLGVIETTGYVVLMLFGATLAHLALGELRPFSHAPGGAVGAVGGELLRSWLNTTGALIVASAVALLALMVASDFTVARIFGSAGRGIFALIARLGPIVSSWWASCLDAQRERSALRLERKEERRAEREALREEKRRLRAELREEGEVESDERGLIRLEEESHREPATNRTDADDEAPSKPSRKPASPPRQPGTNGTPPKVLPVSSTRIPAGSDIGLASTFVRHSSPAAAIAPADEADVHFDISPVDPLADPTWADPEWAAGLPSIGRKGAVDAPQPLSIGWEMESPEDRNGAHASKKKASGRGETVPSTPPIITVPKRPAPAKAAASEGPKANEAVADDTSPPSAPPPAKPAAAALDTRDRAEAASAKTSEPQIIEPKAHSSQKKRKAPTQETFAYMAHGEKFILPSFDFLSPSTESTETEVDREALVETARRLTEKLGDFGIAGEVVQIRPGPVVTMYEFRPGPGVKISKIQGLSDDLAMAMEALRVRIVAPIPGKNAVGIEVPNVKRQMVCMREIIEQDSFRQSKSKLTLAMGKGIEGDPVIVDLAKMPHLLIAGTTGSGKSVAVNGMITSMLYKATPDEVRFIMIDPKVLELKLYEGIPHLLLPVVTDPAKAALALRWATEEMDRRYHLLADLNVRDLATFNRKIDRMRADWEARQDELPPLPPIESVEGDAAAHEALRRQHEERWLADPPPPERLPLLVIVIDELADLMMVASREVETYIARLAQKARAAGIHLLVATQRPSTDVLTGVIKINFPARISFRVASRHDSQTIINEPGAEKLLGNGDMLMIPPGQSEPMRAHGAFLSEGEIEKVVEHLKTQGKPVYDESILQPRDEGGPGADEEDEGNLDPKWDEAISIISERDTISVSWIQRRLAIGYNRAARMIEKMEREGLVGPADGSRPREVLLGSPPP